MKKPLLFIITLFLAIGVHAQNTALHYIKFLHVGEQIMPVHPLNITYGDGVAPRDSAEMINDTLQVISITTDQKSFEELSSYVSRSNFRIRRTGHKIEFGTFKIISDGKRFYLPDLSVTNFFKKMVKHLKSEHADPQLISAIVGNYPWIFNP